MKKLINQDVLITGGKEFIESCLFSFLNKEYLDVRKKFIFLIYFLYLILISSLSFLFLFFFIKNFSIVDSNYNLLLQQIPFGHGFLIQNIIENNSFFQYFANPDGSNEVQFYLKKTLALPLIIVNLYKISTNIFFIVVFKNIFFFSIYFLVCLLFSIEKKIKFINFIILLLIPLLIPYNLIVSLNFVYEDCLIAILLPCLYLCLISKLQYKYYIISLIIFFLYFVKTSMLAIVLIIPILIIFFEKSEKKKFLPLVFGLIAILLWGNYGIQKTGKFPFGSSGSSFNSYVMNFSFNEQFHSYYPSKSPDLMLKKLYPSTIKNEWEFYDYYKKLNIKYLENNKTRFFKDVLIKVKFIFFNIKRDGAYPNEKGEFDNKIKFSLILNKIIFNFSVIVLFLNLISMISLRKIKGFEHNLYFLFLLPLNLLPHLVAWATSKHLVGITLISIIFLFYNIVIFKKPKQ